MKVCVFGSRGWIGQQMMPYLMSSFDEVLSVPSTLRADHDNDVVKYLSKEMPTHVLCLVGRTHDPEGTDQTIDYLEQPGKLSENIRDNMFSPVVLAIICERSGIHFTYMGTGCIFSTDDVEKSPAFTEDDVPNFFGSSYSIVKGYTDRLMHMMPFALNIRIRMPITNEDNPRNFISKIIRYEKVCSVPNSMTVLPTLLPIMVDMMVKKAKGTAHLVNPGIISHNAILEMYKELVDPKFTWQNFSIEEQNKVLSAERSNNHLNTDLMEMFCPQIPDIHTAVRNCLLQWKKSSVQF